MNYDKAKKIADFLNSKITTLPEVALVLGSGLGGFADEVNVEISIPYNEIPEFPMSTVKGHSGRLVFGRLHGKNIIIMQGRIHYYEGYDMQDVVLPIIVFKLLGVSTLILTNSAGGLNSKFYSGAFMQITDHISTFVPSPLMGKNDDRLGTRFPDMTEVYNKGLIKLIDKSAKSLNIEMFKGTYIQTTGPNFETPMEVKMLKKLGGDAVGMSTACEAMVANYLGIKTCAVSCISNMASGLSNNKLTHDEVINTAKTFSEKFKMLISMIIKTI